MVADAVDLPRGASFETPASGGPSG